MPYHKGGKQFPRQSSLKDSGNDPLSSVEEGLTPYHKGGKQSPRQSNDPLSSVEEGLPPMGRGKHLLGLSPPRYPSSPEADSGASNKKEISNGRNPALDLYFS